MNITELNEFIRTELKGCNNYMFIDKVLDEMNIVAKQHPNFSADKFKEWFVEKNVIYKQNPIAFLKKCGIPDMEEGKFDKIQTTGFAMHLFFKRLADNNIAIADENDGLLIEQIEMYLVNNELMTLDELRYWNMSAMDYLKNKNATTKDFIKLFAVSKSTKDFAIPYKQIEKEVKRIRAEWDKAMSSMVGMDYPYGNKGKESETNNDKNKEEKTNN